MRYEKFKVAPYNTHKLKGLVDGQEPTRMVGSWAAGAIEKLRLADDLGQGGADFGGRNDDVDSGGGEGFHLSLIHI